MISITITYYLVAIDHKTNLIIHWKIEEKYGDIEQLCRYHYWHFWREGVWYFWERILHFLTVKGYLVDLEGRRWTHSE